MRYGSNRQSPLNAFKRHWITFLSYNSWKKTLNLLLVTAQYLLKRPNVRGYPVFLKVEPTSRCNLRCPGCIAHGTDFPLEEGDMSLDLFKKVCDELGSYLYKISLYITGEPLLNRDIYYMIAYAAKKRIGTVISTNFHAFDEEKAKRLIDAGLSHIIICLDGAKQDTYEKYRVGGKLETVLRNLEILMIKRAEMNSRHPFVEVQTVLTEGNAKEIQDIRQLARGFKVDRFTVREDLRGYKPASKDQTCFWLWFTSLINEKGIVIPCCASAWIRDKGKEFGNIGERSFLSIWNNEIYRRSREIFLQKKNQSRGEEEAEKLFCEKCDIFRSAKRS